MNNEGKKTEQDLLSALADAVEDSVLNADTADRPDLYKVLMAGEEAFPVRKRGTGLSGLSLEDEKKEKSPEELAAEAQARRAAFEELAADPKLKALDERAAEEEKRLGHHRHHHGEPEPAIAPAPEAEKPEPSVGSEVPAVEEELIPAVPPPVTPDRQAVAEALHELPVQLISDSAESSGKGEISDEDFDIADDFMSGLGC